MKQWSQKQETEAAREFVRRVAAEHGWQVEMREVGAPQYQLCLIKGRGFKLCVYPHRTSAHNIHFRVRNEGSASMAAYSFALCELYWRSGNNCSFQPKHGVGLTPEAKRKACSCNDFNRDELTMIEREMGRPFFDMTTGKVMQLCNS